MILQPLATQLSTSHSIKTDSEYTILKEKTHGKSSKQSGCGKCRIVLFPEGEEPRVFHQMPGKREVFLFCLARKMGLVLKSKRIEDGCEVIDPSLRLPPSLTSQAIKTWIDAHASVLVEDVNYLVCYVGLLRIGWWNGVRAIHQQLRNQFGSQPSNHQNRQM